MNRLSQSFFQQPDTLQIAKDLLGKKLVTNFNHNITSGIITEVEAYCGIADKACHAFGDRRTKRTETMYKAGGVVYVYLCYGIHHLLNIVTHQENNPHAVLIRGIQPVDGVATMLKRRNKKKLDKGITIGPGKVSQALGITTNLDGISIEDHRIWIESTRIIVPKNKIKSTPRIGVDYAGEDAKLPYRFLLPDRYFS